jgi:hypothetical protein
MKLENRKIKYFAARVSLKRKYKARVLAFVGEIPKNYEIFKGVLEFSCTQHHPGKKFYRKKLFWF